MRANTTIALLAAAIVANFLGAARAETIYGITVPGPGGTNLVSFDSANPGAVSTIGAVSGLNVGHVLRGIDFRPADGLLYAMSTLSNNASSAQLYTINLGSGAATPIGAGITLTGNTSTRVSLDFNPVANALRVVTGNSQSYRVNANTGTLIAQDTSISGNPLLSGIAYSNNFVGATQTTLYAYDFLLDNLGTVGGINGVPSPNGGVFSVIGNSGIVTGDAGLGFDISGATGIAYVTVDDFNGSPGVNAEFFTVDLGTGAFTQFGPDDFAPILDISVFVVPEPTSLGLVLMAACAFARRRRA